MRRENFAIFGLQNFRDQPDGDICTIHFLSGRSKALILSCLRYAKFLDTRWFVNDENEIGQFTDVELDELENIVDEAFVEVIVGCDAQDLIKTQRMILAALTGETIDLDSDLPTGNYTPASAVAPALIGDNGNIAQAVEALETALNNIQTAISEAGTAEDLEDDLANVWTVLQAITLALGGTVPVPLPPL